MVNISKVVDDVHLSAFTEKVQTEADSLYRLAYAVLFDTQSAFQVVRSVIEWAAGKMDAIHFQSAEAVRTMVFKEGWQQIVNQSREKGQGTTSGPLTKLAKLKTEARGMLVLNDFLGFKAQEASEILGVTLDNGMAYLIEARKALVS